MHVVSKPWTRLRFFWLLNFPWFCLLLLSYGLTSNSLDSWSDIIYFIVLSIAQAGLYSAILIFCVPAILHLISGTKIPLIGASFTITSLGLFFLCVDRFIFSQFHSHFDNNILAMILSPARGQIFDVSAVDYCCLAGTFLLVVFLQWYLLSKCRNIVKIRRGFTYLGGIPVICFIGAQITYAWADAAYVSNVLLASELSPGFYGVTAKRFLTRHHIVDVSQRPASIQVGNSKLRYPIHPIELSTLSNKPNVLVLTIDSWRYDSLNTLMTPNISKLAEISNNYANHYSGGNSTRAGIFSLFYGVSPSDFDAFYRAGIGPVLFDVLYRQGYQVGVYPSASALSPPFHRTTFVNVKDFIPTTPGETSIERDIKITDQLKTRIQKATQHKQPFFAFAFYDSAHAYNYPKASFTPPFLPAEKVAHLTLNQPKQKELYFNQYRNAVYFVDQLVGEVLDELEKQGALENTLVLITGDHGEEFNDNGQGYWGHNGNFTPVQTHVPLILHWPNQKEHHTYTYLTSHYDVSATLLHDVLGVVNSIGDYSIGTLLNNKSGRSIILIGSYGKLAIFSPAQALIAVSSRLGIFHTENLSGIPSPNKQVSKDLFKLAFAQINHFHAH